MGAVTLEQFAGQTETDYRLRVGEAQIALRLEKAEPLPESGREGGSFRLEFRGPAAPVLPQSTYGFHHGDEVFEIFVVPISSGAEGTLYEAIFY